MNDKKRKVRIRPVEREQPDLGRLARALIDLAISQNQQDQDADKAPDNGEDAEEAA